MIPEIKELNFPSYATLTTATATLQDMGERTIEAQVKIDGGIAPDFSYDWEVLFRGERYVMPLRRPQGAKENTSRRSVIDLTFRHRAEYELKRWLFFTVQPVESGTAVPDKYEASVSLNLKDFCDLFARVLEHYYGDTITIDLNPKWNYSPEPVAVSISHSYLWDVLLQLYELYAVRWTLRHREDDGSKYVIRVGYPATELSHVFRYGFEGGLLKVERQQQQEELRNILEGRGGTKNLPYRYFKDTDPSNQTFGPDPDWIPELKDLYFDRLRGATFRSYVQGWKTRHYGGAAVTEAAAAYAPWAWEKGYTDTEFNPVEYVKDDASILRHGPLQGGLPDNEEIFPTLQGASEALDGRLDVAVDVEQVTDDNPKQDNGGDETGDILVDQPPAASGTAANTRRDTEYTIVAEGGPFEVPAGMTAYLEQAQLSVTAVQAESTHLNRSSVLWHGSHSFATEFTPVSDTLVEILDVKAEAFRNKTGEPAPSVLAIPEGQWYYRVKARVKQKRGDRVNLTLHVDKPVLLAGVPTDDAPNGTFRVWIKNVWGTAKGSTESAAAYAERVWRPLLGDREGNEAKVVFASGMLSTSEDYEFTIIEGGVAYDTSKTLDGVRSEWCLTLARSDADFESFGLYVPSTRRQGKAGDRFFFTGIDLPHRYVVLAERRLDDYKKDELGKVSDPLPTWSVTLDKVRIASARTSVTRHDGGSIELDDGSGLLALDDGGFLMLDELTADTAAETIINAIEPGAAVRLADKRFITDAPDVPLVLQSVTFEFREPSSSSPAIIPDVSVVLSDKPATGGTEVQALQGEVEAIRRQLGSVSNVEQIVRAVGDRNYLRKNGDEDTSLSPTRFSAPVSSADFRQGGVGGAGWGFFRDERGAAVLEADRLVLRRDLQVNNLVVNQVTARGGMSVQSAASMECAFVVQTPEGYECHFDRRQGTVPNLFVAGDIALYMYFDADNPSEGRYYRRLVKATGDDYILLSDAVGEKEAASDVPMQGDVIVQYGNIDPASGRTYVIVNDVVGGGYETYIEGLDSVTAEGREYYFAGRQSGAAPRWFVGNRASHYVEWSDGRLTVKGELSVESTIGGKPITDYLSADDYLRRAMQESATISGGLVLASLIQLGYTQADGTFRVMAGLNGINGSDDTLAFWAGGDMADEALTPGAGARFAVRMDGSAYAAGNTIRFRENTVEVGNDIELRNSGLFLKNGSRYVAAIKNESVARDIDYQEVGDKQFNETIDLGDLSADIYTYPKTEGGGLQLQGKYALLHKKGTAAGTSLFSRTYALGTLAAGSVFSYKLGFAGRRMKFAPGEPAGLGGWLGNTATYVKVEILCDGTVLSTTRHGLRYSVKMVVEDTGFTDGGLQPADPDRPILPLASATPSVSTEVLLETSIMDDITVEQGGNYQVRLTTEDSTTAATPVPDGSIDDTVKTNIAIRTGKSYPDMTLVGNDGLLSAWGDTAFTVERGGIVLRSGNYRLRVSADGIKKSTDGKTWTDL